MHIIFTWYYEKESKRWTIKCVRSHAGTTYLEANLIDISGQWPSMNLSCSYAFVRYNYDGYDYRLMDNAMEIDELGHREVALDWRIGVVSCKEDQQNKISYACLDINSDCVDFDATLGGYLCNCSKGYQGNPYLISGCQGW